MLMVSRSLHEAGDPGRYRSYGWRVSADDGDDLVPVHLQPGVKANHDVVSEHASGVLQEHNC
jgi:hypothetical protein